MIKNRLLRSRRGDDQAHRDVHRAEVLVARTRGITDVQSAAALRRQAAENEVSLHAAALAALSTTPPDERPLDD